MPDSGLNPNKVSALILVVVRKVLLSSVFILSLGSLVTTTGCSNEPDIDLDESGIIGTGIMLRGAVSSTVLASNDIVEVKSIGGQLSELSVDATRQFSTTSLSGKGPWVLSVKSNANVAVYGIAYSDGTRNINRFSDLSLRRWFAKESLDLDSEFGSSGRFTDLPTAEEYAQSTTDVFQLIEPVLNSYNVIGEDAISANYMLNDQGIDGFLNRNSVLIENGFITFLITEQATNTQSANRSALKLKNDFLDRGLSAPTVPSSLRALGSSADEIIVVWEPSTDDVAVFVYEVWRDEVLVATTPYPVFIDSGLAARSYSYQVIAVDGAGNRSPASLPEFASPLQLSDVVPPPAPSLLLALDITSSAIELLWEQSNIGDVVRFNLLRGFDAQTVGDVVLRLTSNRAVDTTVVANQTYCYQVEAVDASGNVSAGSDVLCVTATDAIDSDANSPLGEWNVPEVDPFTCNQVLSSDQFQLGVTVLERGCYLVPESLSIGAGATLRISAGAVLKFGDRAALIIPRNATLTTNGTLDDPVVLTGEVDIPGYWAGLEFRNSRSAGNLVRGTVIQYAGGPNSTDAGIASRLGPSRFRIEDTLVRRNQTIALDFNSSVIILDSFRGNRITENDSIGVVSMDTLPSLAGNSDFTGNVSDTLDVPGSTYSNVQHTIPDLGITLDWNGVTIERGSLTIEPGANLSMVPGAVVDIDGVFSAIGTVEKPINIVGSLSTTPSWSGLRLSGKGNKTLAHVNITDGGEPRPDSGAIDISCTVQAAAKVSIDNVQISDSAGWGIFIGGQGCVTEIGENITYFNNALGNSSIP